MGSFFQCQLLPTARVVPLAYMDGRRRRRGREADEKSVCGGRMEEEEEV